MKGNEILWKQVLETIRVLVSAATFSTWFSQTFIVSIKTVSSGRQSVEIGCPSPYIRDQLEKRYFGMIQDCLQQLTGKINDVIFVIKPKLPNYKHTSSPLFGQNGEDEKALEARIIKASLPNGFTFANFAVSPINQFAWAATQAVSKSPGRAYNPLFIWGGVGVGKTHLMAAVGYEIIKNFPNSKVLYSTSDEFTIEIIEAIKTKTTNEFKKRYRNIDVLLIDDIQSIAGKPTVQEEFFNTFNFLHKAGKQIIVTSDQPPGEISKLTERLKNRFDAGLIVDIAQPDFELRCAILMIKAKERGVNLSMESISFIADIITSPRALEGFLVRLESQASLAKTQINQTLVEKILGQRTAGNGKTQVSPNELISNVCEYFQINKKMILSQKRTKQLVFPRQIVMYLMRSELKLTLEEIGRLLGGRDHTTIIHGVDKISQLLNSNQELEQNIKSIKQQLWG